MALVWAPALWFRLLCGCLRNLGFRIYWASSGPFRLDPSAFVSHTLSCGPIYITLRDAPSWHRRLRARRSKQRRTVKRCRQLGALPPFRVLYELSSQHSRPRFREFMGKRGSHKQWAGRWAAQQSASSWDAWGFSAGGNGMQPCWDVTGSWEATQAAAQNPPVSSNKGKGKEHLFPKYSDIKVQHFNRGSGPGLDLVPQQSQDMEQIKEVQRHVNTIRKTEAKICRCKEQALQREQQWQEFQQQLKTSFMEQRTAFSKDKAQNRQEESQLFGQRQQAVDSLKVLVTGGTQRQARNTEAVETCEILQAALHNATVDSTAGLHAYRQQVGAWLNGQETLQPISGAPTTPTQVMSREAGAHVQAFRETKQDLRTKLKQDRLLWIQQLARDAGEISSKQVVQRLRPLLGPPKRKANVGCGMPAAAKLDGSLAQDADEVRERWIEHFSLNEGGRRCPTEELVSACQARQRLQRLDVPDSFASELPSRLQLEAALRGSATGRAVGPDGLPAELLHYGAGSIALPIYQLMLKMVLRLEEPIAFKGGFVHHLWKGKSAPHLCKAIVPSLFLALLAKRFAERFVGIAPFLKVHSPLQVGGIPKHRVLAAAHAARMFASLHKKSNCFLLFLDLREAFYRVARPMLVDMQHTEEDIARVLRELHLLAEAFQDFRRNLDGPTATSRAGASEWLQSLFRELLSNTWFRLPQQPDVVVTDLGTRPGDNLADLMFSYLFASVLSRVKDSLLSEGIDVSLPWHDAMRGSSLPVDGDPSSAGVRLTDCTWMDDMCLMVSTKSACDLFPALRFAAETLLDLCLGHGMTPNLDKGKSEAIAMVHGAGSRLDGSICLAASLQLSVRLSCGVEPESALHLLIGTLVAFLPNMPSVKERSDLALAKPGLPSVSIKSRSSPAPLFLLWIRSPFSVVLCCQFCCM